MRFAAVTLAVVLSTSSAAADDIDPGVLPTAAAVVPGAIVHGLGHWVGGDWATAKRLLLAEGVGLGFIAAGVVPLVASGASRRMSTAPIASMITGVGIFTASWLSDIYGSATGGTGYLAPGVQRTWTLEAGHQYVRDPQFDYAQFVTARLSARKRRFGAHLAGWVAADADNQRVRAEGEYRLLASRDSWLDAVPALTYHRYGDDGFSVVTGEASVRGRYALSRIARPLYGAFVTGAIGWGWEVVNYKAPGAGRDLHDLLLADFGFGFYLANGTEVRGYYRHRRDDFAGGISPSPGQGSGFAGSFGARTVIRLPDNWAFVSDVNIGSALVLSTAVQFSFGDIR